MRAKKIYDYIKSFIPEERLDLVEMNNRLTVFYPEIEITSERTGDTYTRKNVYLIMKSDCIKILAGSYTRVEIENCFIHPHVSTDNLGTPCFGRTGILKDYLEIKGSSSTMEDVISFWMKMEIFLKTESKDGSAYKTIESIKKSISSYSNRKSPLPMYSKRHLKQDNYISDNIYMPQILKHVLSKKEYKFLYQNGNIILLENPNEIAIIILEAIDKYGSRGVEHSSLLELATISNGNIYGLSLNETTINLRPIKFKGEEVRPVFDTPINTEVLVPRARLVRYIIEKIKEAYATAINTTDKGSIVL